MRGGGERSRRGREREEEGVTLRIDLDSALAAHASRITRRCSASASAYPSAPSYVQQLRRPLDVGEEESDGAGRKVVAHAA